MPIPCARCEMPLPTRELASGEAATCTACGAANTAEAFPALLAPSHGAAPPEPAVEGEAACFDHPARQAVGSCQQCGRYCCRLCLVEFGELSWCPSCVAAGAGKASRAHPVTSRNLYDSTALILPLASLIVWPFTVIAAPASLVLSVLKWGQPLSLVRRNRWRFVAAILVSVAEIAGWGTLIVYLASGRFPVTR